MQLGYPKNLRPVLPLVGDSRACASKEGGLYDAVLNEQILRVLSQLHIACLRTSLLSWNLNTTLKTNHHRGVVKHLFFWCSHRTTNIFKDEDGEKSLNLLKPPARSYHDDIMMTS